MNWDRTTNAPCIIPEAPVADARCLDSEFSLSHPDICASSLIIKPASASLCVLDSLQFKVYEYRNGVETELTSGVTYESSNRDTFVIGVNGGAGTSFAEGEVIITATYDGRTVTAGLTVLPGTNCCADIRVRTAVVVDNSRSMSLNFGGGYATRLVFAKAIATAYGGTLLTNDAGVKDAIKVWSLNDVATPLQTGFSTDTAAILAAITSITQTQGDTNLLEAFSLAANDLLDVEAERRVLLLISDGEQTTDGVTQQAVLDLAFTFKAAGGIIIVIGTRASNTLGGFDLLERIATGGFYINAAGATAAETFESLNFLKSLLCAGDCLPVGDTYANVPDLNFSSFLNWEVISGQANLLGPGLLDLLPGNGLYVELAYPGTAARSTIRSIDSYALVTGNVYSISFKIAGNQTHPVAGVPPKVYLRSTTAADTDANVFEANIGAAWNSPFTTFNLSFTATSDQTVRLYFSHQPVGTNSGALIDDIVFTNSSTLETLLADNFDTENLQYVPPRCGGSAAVAGIANPAAPEVTRVLYGGSDIELGETYTYSISWVTNDGETAEAVAADYAAFPGPEAAIRLDLPTPPAEVTAVRVWRSVSDASPNRFLLATLTPENTTYFDLESHTEFAARYDVDLTPPTTNTTGIDAGELGVGYADCCDYYGAPEQSHFSIIFPHDQSFVRTSAPLAGATDNKTGTISFWTKQNSSWFFFGDNGIESFGVITGFHSGLYSFEITAFSDAGATLILNMTALEADVSLDDNQWHHVAASWDLSDPAKRHLYIDGIDRLDPGINVHVNAAILWSQVQWTIGPLAGGGGGQPKVYETWLATTYLDLSVPGNLAKFITAGGDPENLGLDGSIPTGVAPLIYLRKRAPDWHQNQGSGGGFPPPEFIPVEDGGTDVPGPLIVDGDITYTDNCPDCATESPGVQAADPSNLADIEGGTVPPLPPVPPTPPPVSCPTGFLNLNATGTPSALLSNVGGATIVTTFFTGSAIVPGYYKIGGNAGFFPIAWRFEASNNGTTWTVLDTKLGQSSANSAVRMALVENNTTAYSYFRLVITEWAGTVGTLAQPPLTSSAFVYAAVPATAASLDLLNCQPFFTVTKSYTASCSPNTYGNPVTVSKTRTSLVSASEAEADALAAATLEADAVLDCTLSNNTSNLQFNNGTVVAATPYPSVKYVSGLVGPITKVTVTLSQIRHAAFEVVCLVLRAPDGTTVMLLNPDNVAGEMVFSAPQDVTFDDDAATVMPYGNPHAGGTFKPTIVAAGETLQFPGAAPTQPYGLVLSDFDGLDPNGSWSLWAIHKQLYTLFNPVNARILNGWDLTISV